MSHYNRDGSPVAHGTVRLSHLTLGVFLDRLKKTFTAEEGNLKSARDPEIPQSFAVAPSPGALRLLHPIAYFLDIFILYLMIHKCSLKNGFHKSLRTGICCAAVSRRRKLYFLFSSRSQSRDSRPFINPLLLSGSCISSLLPRASGRL